MDSENIDEATQAQQEAIELDVISFVIHLFLAKVYFSFIACASNVYT